MDPVSNKMSLPGKTAASALRQPLGPRRTRLTTPAREAGGNSNGDLDEPAWEVASHYLREDPHGSAVRYEIRLWGCFERIYESAEQQISDERAVTVARAILL